MPKTPAKKTVKATSKAVAKKPTKVTAARKVTKVVKPAVKPRRVVAEKPLLFKEVELGAMGIFVVVLIILFIGVAGSLALSFASSEKSDNEYPLLYRMFYPTEKTVEVKKTVRPEEAEPTVSPTASAIPVKISN
jgi:hypothetical protein